MAIALDRARGRPVALREGEGAEASVNTGAWGAVTWDDG